MSPQRQTSALAPLPSRIAGVVHASLQVWVFLSFLVFYIGVTRGHFWTTDEIEVYQQTESLAERGNLAVAPVFTNTVTGRDGRTYAPYGAGQSVLSVPLYELGRAVHVGLNAIGAQSWVDTFAGQTIGQPGKYWSGQIEIFFVNLFNAFAGAALMAVFFSFSCRLGAKPAWALPATAILGIASHLAGFTTGYLQHIAEGLFPLWAFYQLHEDRLTPSSRSRLLAGASVCIMLLVRPSTVVFLPTLALYLVWNAWQRRGKQTAEVIRETLPFIGWGVAGFLTVCAVNYWKLGEFSFEGSYAHINPLNTPWTVGLYGFLYTPGESVFLFSPMLILAPWWFSRFQRENRAETTAILVMSVTYLLVFSKAYPWHGQWSFGPRYLAATLPLLLLPLGGWIQTMRRERRIWLTPLLAVSLLVSALHIFVNVSYVYYHEGYDHWPASEGFLYIADGFLYKASASQIPAHMRALLAWDSRVDFWLLNVFRTQGAGRFFIVFAPLAGLLTLCCVRLRRLIREATPAAIATRRYTGERTKPA